MKPETYIGYKRQQSIMRYFESVELMNRNLMQEATISLAFQPDWLDAMADENRNYNLHNDIDYVFITIDPSAGSAKSLYVILSMFYPETKNGRTCIVCILFKIIKAIGHPFYTCTISNILK